MKNKLLLLVLIGLSLVWFAAWFQHARAYNQMIEKDRERLGDYIVDEIMDYYPIILWENGPLLSAIGFIIATFWAFSVLSFYQRRKKLKE
jgi:hypothetical protein